jgi:phosphohistidine phosphatase
VKTLYIIRHAKSSWENPMMSDLDRPLNERGKRDAPRMGKRLKEKAIHPNVMISSPAKRAFGTAKRIAEALGYPKEKIKKEKSLYHGDEVGMLSAVQDINDKYEVAILFGHNPGLTDFVNSLMDGEMDIDNVPTCGVVAFELNLDHWKDAAWGKGKMLFFDYPKSKED